MQKAIIALKVYITEILQAFVKYPGSQRVATQGRIWRIDIAGLKAQYKQMTNTKQKSYQQCSQQEGSYGGRLRQMSESFSDSLRSH